MDITALSMTLSQSKLNSDIGVALLSKSLDTTEAMGDEFVKMMEQSVTPNLGTTIDISL